MKRFDFFEELFGFQNKCDSFGYELEDRGREEENVVSRCGKFPNGTLFV